MKNILLNYIADETITSGNDFRDKIKFPRRHNMYK